MRWLPFLALVACTGSDPSSDTDTKAPDVVDTDTDSDSDSDDTNDTTDTEDTDDGPPPTAEDVTLGGACPLDIRVGGILVQGTSFYTAVDGAVNDGVVPVEVLEDVGGNDECRLLKRNLLFCDPACGFDETCGFDGECVPFPLNIDLGELQIDGLVEGVTLQPQAPGFQYTNTSLPHPAIVPGELITMTTGGSDTVPAMKLHGVGMDPVALASKDIWLMVENEPLVMQWTPSTSPVARSEVFVRIDIDQHGVSPVRAFCVFEDDGEAELPAELVNELIAFGVTGFPNATLNRRTVDSTILPDGQCMEFEVRYPVAPTVRVDGYVPCSSNFDCPDGQVCDLAIELCVDP